MANKTPNIQHLKQGKAYPDPIATGKTNSHFTTAANDNRITDTPDSKSKCDGYLGGKNSPDGARGWAPVNDAAKPNTWTGNSGSKRD